MHATALMEHYAFAWRLTGDPRWLKRARDWLRAAAEWEHSDRVEQHFYTNGKQGTSAGFCAGAGPAGRCVAGRGESTGDRVPGPADGEMVAGRGTGPGIRRMDDTTPWWTTGISAWRRLHLLEKHPDARSLGGLPSSTGFAAE